mmetsp:Transcript_10390/g.34172  ORF Transcript_10390/g.34172 Transcript_10390/m.34172 type:complete len:435 (-) Transcript_10390:1130-2434(-)
MTEAAAAMSSPALRESPPARRSVRPDSCTTPASSAQRSRRITIPACSPTSGNCGFRSSSAMALYAPDIDALSSSGAGAGAASAPSSAASTSSAAAASAGADAEAEPPATVGCHHPRRYSAHGACAAARASAASAAIRNRGGVRLPFATASVASRAPDAASRTARRLEDASTAVARSAASEASTADTRALVRMSADHSAAIDAKSFSSSWSSASSSAEPDAEAKLVLASVAHEVPVSRTNANLERASVTSEGSSRDGAAPPVLSQCPFSARSASSAPAPVHSGGKSEAVTPTTRSTSSALNVSPPSAPSSSPSFPELPSSVSICSPSWSSAWAARTAASASSRAFVASSNVMVMADGSGKSDGAAPSASTAPPRKSTLSPAPGRMSMLSGAGSASISSSISSASSTNPPASSSSSSPPALSACNSRRIVYAGLPG